MSEDTPPARRARIERGELMTYDDICARLTVTPKGFRLSVRRRRFPEPIVSVGRVNIWRREDVEAWVKYQRTKGWYYTPRPDWKARNPWPLPRREASPQDQQSSERCIA